MATTTNYGWTTPDDTALVKDGASAIRTLGSSVDTTTKALNPSTTLGDIEYRSSTANTNTRLGIGSTGQVLTVAGGVPSWATAGASAENYALINTGGTTLTGAATFTVSGISAKGLFLYIENAQVSSGDRLRITFNSDTTNNYQFTGARASAGAAYLPYRSGDVANIEFLRNGTSTSSGNYGFLQFRGCDGTGFKPFVSTSNCTDSTTSGNEYIQSGYYKGTSAITTVQLFTSSGNNFTGGKFYVYGAV
jgi:hypothetical protein